MRSGVASINAQNLPWKASLRQAHEGKRIGDFGLGYRPPSLAARHAAPVTRLSASGTPPPLAFDARDVYANQTACRAFEVLDQGGCGSCYAFSSATAYSARLCRAAGRGSVANIVLSPQASALSTKVICIGLNFNFTANFLQELMDCTNGCDGGNPIEVYTAMLKSGAVELWCLSSPGDSCCL